MQKPLAGTADELDAVFKRFLLKFRRVGASNIQRFAESFCETMGLHEFPRDPRVYLPLLGIRLKADTLSRGINAVWLRTESGYDIVYSRHLAGKLGLVLWHEFFEILSAHPGFPTRIAPDAEERLATLFAVHLMMPEKEVRRQAAELGHPGKMNKSRVLSSRFGVSLTAMRLRLRELGLEHPSEITRRSYV